jgi:hypothetical protein
MPRSFVVLPLLALTLIASGCKKEARPLEGSAAAAQAKPAQQSGAAQAGHAQHAEPAHQPGEAHEAPQLQSGPACKDREKAAVHALKQGTKVLAGVKLTEVTKPSDLLASGGLYEGKTVRVEGPIRGICKGRGCWAAVEGPDGQTVNLKVDDGVVDFRKLAKLGQYAVGEGVYNAEGHHGAQVKITGAMIGPACE